MRSVFLKNLNAFELARIVGARALQLSLGAPPLIKVTPEMSFINVAKEELEKGVTPLVVIK
ncbi:DNA-directed RNA polymerase subunit K [Candidatus Micrarchaeota archaeon]|nr:DNA-directed RNA polymerase subunit K [Candidatus Micrarchaeota archaeon]MBD3417659.1 DNA-directed RNA polymerase subunit K [Candidatus Micrarchaeota archaeon]